MSEHVTVEAVEKAAQALHDIRSMRSRALHEIGQPLRDTVYGNERRDDARAVLEAAAPLIAAQALRDAAGSSIPRGALARETRSWLRGRADQITGADS